MVADRSASEARDMGMRSGAQAPLKWRLIRALALVSAICLASNAFGRTFSVVDSVNWQSVVPQNSEGSVVSLSPRVVTYSPSGDRFVLVARGGDAATDSTIERLVAYRSTDVQTCLASDRESCAELGVEIFRLRSTGRGGRISGLRWLDDQRLAFVGEGANGAAQVQVLDVETRQVRQRTAHSTDVVAFDVNGDTVLYFALAAVPLSDIRLAGAQQIGRLLAPAERGSDRAIVDLFLDGGGVGEGARRLTTRSILLLEGFRRVSISPNARYAIVSYPATNYAPHWDDYVVRFPDTSSFRFLKGVADPASPVFQVQTTNLLVDLRNYQIRPLMDAPHGFPAQNGTPSRVIWMEGERSVVLSNSYLPLLDVSAGERRRRVAAPAVAEVDLTTGRATAIMFEPVAESGAAYGTNRRGPVWPDDRVTSVEWFPGARLLRLKMHSDANNSDSIRTFMRGARGNWSETTAHAASVRSPAFDVQQTQSLNRRPMVFAQGGRCACSKLLFDPNPGADDLEIGKTEAVIWRDPRGVEWKAGLVYPASFSPGRRHPLILQTHGFSANEFIVDGPGTGMYAARALASAGFLVLQVEDNRRAGDERFFMRAWADAYKAGIDMLVDQGLVDAQRVGVIAYSATGAPTVELLRSYPNLVHAAVFGDASVGGSYLSALQSLNSDMAGFREHMSSWLGEFGADAESISRWMAARPVYHLAETSAPLRIEAYMAETSFYMWEPFALLRYRAGLPAEFVYIAAQEHALFLPRHRLASLGGTVDWFRFWLQSYEDPAPGKADQYSRWRTMRSQWCESNMKPAQLHPACVQH